MRALAAGASLARPRQSIMGWAGELVLRPLQILTAAPGALFLTALTAMLFRHSEVATFPVDRVVFVLLAVGVGGRMVALRQSFFLERASWPMIGLTLMALAGLIGRSFDPEAWSLLASKYVVPFMMFHLAGFVFIDEREFRRFEYFGLVVLGYLSFTSIAFLSGAHFLVFPRFILDGSIGFHADRARGPFLQAVANGVSLNLLGVLAVHAYERRGAQGRKLSLLLASVPVAVLATMTRAVWLSFAGTLFCLALLSRNFRIRRFTWATIVCAGMGLAIAVAGTGLGSDLDERIQDRGPVEYREAVYSAGWEMFLERPLLGWGFHQMPAELPRHVSGYDEKVLYPHNTYLEILVENGMLGVALYAWLMWEMVRLRRGAIPAGERRAFLGDEFHRLWPILLCVYWLNATVVVMSYQFVNSVLFSLAGMLAAQRRRAEVLQPC